jgi:PBP1b-binding outer membrane lipoprotein LpoB
MKTRINPVLIVILIIGLLLAGCSDKPVSTPNIVPNIVPTIVSTTTPTKEASLVPQATPSATARTVEIFYHDNIPASGASPWGGWFGAAYP